MFPLPQNPTWNALMGCESRLLERRLRRVPMTRMLSIDAAGLVPVPCTAPWCMHASPAGDGSLRGVVVADAEAWPFADASMDVVVLRHALGEWKEPWALLREASRVLVPGGHLYVCGVHPLSPWRAWLAWQGDREARAWSLHGPGRLRRGLRAIGLTEGSCTRYGPILPLRSRPASEEPRLLGPCWLLQARKPGDGIIRLRADRRREARMAAPSLLAGSRRQGLPRRSA